MRFKVGPWNYSVRIAEGVITHEGTPAHVVAIENEQLILLSGDCPRRQRLPRLASALMDVWVNHTGEPRTRAGWCDLAGTMSVALIRDLGIAGGIEALVSLEPGEGIQSTTLKASTLRQRYCYVCRGTVASGSVYYAPSAHRRFVDVAIYCPHCKHIQRWKEIGNGLTGITTGQTASEPEFEKGEACEAFLKEHPHLVEQD